MIKQRYKFVLSKSVVKALFEVDCLFDQILHNYASKLL